MLAGLMLLAWTSCEDYNKEFLDEAVTTLYLKNSGETPLTIYRAGVDDIYKIVVDKTGYDLTAETDAEIILLNQIDLDIYNQEQGVAYKLLPNDCYVLPADLNCRFGKDDLYKTFDLTLKTEVIYNLLLAATADETYVLPLQLVASNDSINAEKNHLFLVPKVEIPTVYFNKTGFINNPVSINDPSQTITLTLPIELIIDNRWSFDCTVSVNEDLLTAYNTENEAAYRLLPEDVYTINPTVSFVPGTSLANVEVQISRASLSLGTYILPLQLNSVSNEYFEIDGAKNACLFGISYTPPRDALQRVPLTESMITVLAPAQEGSVANLCDNDPNTYYHSPYSGTRPYDPVYGVYIDVALPDPVNSIAVDYRTRHNNGNGAPKFVKLYGSMDGSTWDLIGILSGDLPTTSNTAYSSPVFSSPDQFKYFRFAVIEAPQGKLNQDPPSFFALGELSLYAQ
jgi:hypothetical protein